MNESTILDKWLELNTLAKEIGWTVERDGPIYNLIPDFGSMIALRTRSMDEAIGFINGFAAGRRVTKQRKDLQF